MKQAILCEGKTDAILISYFLKKKFSWNYVPKSDKLPRLPVNRDNETLNWYTREDRVGNELAIWAVGGFNVIGNKFLSLINRTQMESTPSDRFSRVVIVFDRDNRNVADCELSLSKWLSESNIDYKAATIGAWFTVYTYLKKEPKEEHPLQILCICVPADGKGCLETFLMDCLEASTKPDKELVGEAKLFVSKISDDPYLPKGRLRSKACLGSILSVISPDWVFSKLDERLTFIEWEKFAEVNTVFDEFKIL